jgi:hypothetical protein
MQSKSLVSLIVSLLIPRFVPVLALCSMSLTVGCSTLPGAGGGSGGASWQDRYSGEDWLVVVRGSAQEVEEVEIHGLLARRVVSASGQAIQRLPDGTFEVDLLRSSIVNQGKFSGASPAALLKSRGVSRILLDWVGDVALRVRLDGNSESALVLNRERGADESGGRRLPAGITANPGDLLPFERFSPTRY